MRKRGGWGSLGRRSANCSLASQSLFSRLGIKCTNGSHSFLIGTKLHTVGSAGGRGGSWHQGGGKSALSILHGVLSLAEACTRSTVLGSP